VSGANQTVGPVTFDYAWMQRFYPTITEWCDVDVLQGYFDLACVFCDNRDAGGVMPSGINPIWDFYGCPGSRWVGSPVRDIPTRQRMLGLLTAHIATLFAPLNGQPSPNMVGRISGASEGSVSVSYDIPTIAGAEWFGLTKFGWMYWQMTLPYRTFRYIPGRQPFREVGGSGGVY
jgi:hypothetical protein